MITIIIAKYAHLKQFGLFMKLNCVLGMFVR